jgi:hypothetical protein
VRFGGWEGGGCTRTCFIRRQNTENRLRSHETAVFQAAPPFLRAVTTPSSTAHVLLVTNQVFESLVDMHVPLEPALGSGQSLDGAKPSSGLTTPTHVSRVTSRGKTTLVAQAPTHTCLENLRAAVAALLYQKSFHSTH